MNVVNDVTKCPYCKNVYDVPVVLICCSECICQNHIDEIRNKDPENKFICPFCDENNEINKFPINKKIDTLLKSNFDKLNLEKEYHEAKQKCENLKTLLNKVNHLTENPNAIIDEYVADMKLKTDLKREMAKKEIDDICDRLMNEMDTFKSECYENIETIMAEKGYKNKLEEIKKEFDVEKHILDFELFNTDKSTWNSHKSSAKLQLVKLNNISYELKNDLLMHKVCKLDNIINIKDFKSNTNKFQMMQKYNIYFK